VLYGKQNCATPLSQALLLRSENLYGVVPNVFVASRTYVIDTNCTGERSFSKMAIIKNKLRSSMTFNRLTALYIYILSVGIDVVRRISLDEIVNDFAAKNRECVICKVEMAVLANLMIVDMTACDDVIVASCEYIILSVPLLL
jgi:hypothetical protein